MAEPNWSKLYDFSQAPEVNGFTRRTHQGEPGVNIVTSGQPANRRIEVDSTSGDLTFLTSAVPSFDGPATAEFTIAITGPAAGNVGMEVTFLDRAFAMQVYPAKVGVLANGKDWTEAATASNAGNTVFRVTWDGSAVRIYRAGTLVLGPVSVPAGDTHGFQRFLWWVEEGAVVTIRKVAFFLAGAEAP